MKAQAQAQVALVIAAVLFLGWGLALLIKPHATHALLSTAANDPATTAMFGGALFAFAAMFFIAWREPAREIVYASAVSLMFLGVVAGYQLLIGKHMPQNPATVITLVLTLGISVYLFISLTEAAMNLAAVARKGRRSSARKTATKARRKRRR